MSLNSIYLLSLVLVAGIASGIFGIGGGVIVVPILVFLFALPMHQAVGVSMVALLAPVGILGVLEYYREGKIHSADIKIGILIAVGIFFGAYLGARAAVLLPEQLMRRFFALLLCYLAVRMWRA